MSCQICPFRCHSHPVGGTWSLLLRKALCLDRCGPFFSFDFLSFFFFFFATLPSSQSLLFSDLPRFLFFFFFFALLLARELSSPLKRSAIIRFLSTALWAFTGWAPVCSHLVCFSVSESPLSKATPAFFFPFSISAQSRLLLFSSWAAPFSLLLLSRKVLLKNLNSFSRAVTFATFAAFSRSFSLGVFSLFSSSLRFFSLSFFRFRSPGAGPWKLSPVSSGSIQAFPLEALAQHSLRFLSVPFRGFTSRRSSSFHVLHFPRCTVTSCCPAAGHSSVGPLHKWYDPSTVVSRPVFDPAHSL